MTAADAGRDIAAIALTTMTRMKKTRVRRIPPRRMVDISQLSDISLRMVSIGRRARLSHSCSFIAQSG
jgi:hypothetical protein